MKKKNDITPQFIEMMRKRLVGKGVTICKDNICWVKSIFEDDDMVVLSGFVVNGVNQDLITNYKYIYLTKDECEALSFNFKDFLNKDEFVTKSKEIMDRHWETFDKAKIIREIDSIYG